MTDNKMLTEHVLDLWSSNSDELDRDELLWSRETDGWHFYVPCNDFFGPGADCEEIRAEDLELLRQAITDCRQAGDAAWGPYLWVSRKRQRPPWFRRLKIREEVRPLFEALTKAETG
jgi:hypothetical protein